MSSEHFPAHLELITPDTVAELRTRGEAFDHPLMYVEHLAGKYHDHPVFSRTFSVVSLFGSTQTSPYGQEVMERKKAFLAGNLLGTELLDATGGQVLLNHMLDVDVHVPRSFADLSPAEQEAKTGELVRSSALETYKEARLLHPVVNSWGRKIVDRQRQKPLRAGIGFILNMGAQAIAQFEFKALQDAVDGDPIDWEQELDLL